MSAGDVAAPRLRALIEGSSPSRAREDERVGQLDFERCDLCGEPVPPQHRHVIDLESRELMCACMACSVLFDRDGAGGGHFRLVSERCLFLEGFRMDDLRWLSFRIPVGMAFFIRDGESRRVKAYYPSLMGATESLLELESWSELEADNPVLAEMVPDTEALLVNRVNGAREHWIVGIDECYRLVALVRTKWEGLSGGSTVWKEIGRFFDEMRAHAQTRS